MKILLVDDNREILDDLSNVFANVFNYEVEKFDNVNDALVHFKTDYCPIIFADINMPDKTGFDLLKEIKSLPKGEKTKVILFTGYADLDSAVEALRVGAFDYVFKPINIKKLEETLTRAAQSVTIEETV